MKTVIALRHVAFEHLDALEPPLKAAGYAIRYLDAADGLPGEDVDCDLLVVLGGPMSVYEQDRYPFLKAELKLIEARLASKRPLLGICLGAQLIARAAGARVYPSGINEIGFAPIALTAAGRRSCLAGFTDAPQTLHWHGDTFDLPDGAIHLARTPDCENQAFSLGPSVLGLQFHPETSAANLEHWLVGHAGELDAAGIEADTLRQDARKLEPVLADRADKLMTRWLCDLQLAH